MAINFVVVNRYWIHSDPTWPETKAQLTKEVCTGTDENCTL